MHIRQYFFFFKNTKRGKGHLMYCTLRNNHLIIISTECKAGEFGQNCTESCGNCVQNEACHHVNGSCLNGCDAGYEGTNCTQGKSIQTGNFIPKKMALFGSHESLSHCKLCYWYRLQVEKGKNNMGRKKSCVLYTILLYLVHFCLFILQSVLSDCLGTIVVRIVV